MALNKELLEILACPTCKSALTLTPAQDRLVCEACKVAYPIEDDIPILLADKAIPLSGPFPDSESAA
jgi:uncharacterized protein YbaR (Trm112 family)